MFREINLRDADPQFLCDLLHWPLLQDVAIKDLILLSAYFLFHPFGRGLQQMAMPFFIPRRVEIEPGRIGDFFDCRRLRVHRGEFSRIVPRRSFVSGTDPRFASA